MRRIVYRWACKALCAAHTLAIRLHLRGISYALYQAHYRMSEIACEHLRRLLDETVSFEEATW